MIKLIMMAVMVLVTLAGCDQSPPPKVEPMQKLTVAFTTQPQCALIHVALTKGFFAEERLDIQPLMRTYGKESLQALLDGQADLAAAAETPIMFSILKGKQIYILANIDANTTNNAILARKDAGILKPADLKGKRIGFTPGTTSDFFMHSFLTANGLHRQDVQAVEMKPAEMRDALLAGKIDAVSTWNFQLTKISNELGTNGTTFFDKDIYTETYNLVAQQAFVQKNPEVIKRFLRALVKAENFVRHEPAAAQKIVAQAIHGDENLVRSLWDGFSYHVVHNQVLLITLEDETRWAISNHLTDRQDMPDYLSFIYLDGLLAVKPEAVQIKK